MSKAELLYGKLRSIAASDKSTITALKQMKSDKPKARKDEDIQQTSLAKNTETDSKNEAAMITGNCLL